jgi:putative SOS response-associated peptidase YedK
MCGRYTLHAPPEAVAGEFGLPAVPSLRARYNVAPRQLVAAVGLGKDRVTRGLVHLRWGLVPYWVNNPDEGPRPINARAETVAWKFGEQLREKRCLIPADGFFEWRAEGKKKRGQHFTRADGGLFAFAGLWDVWSGEDEKLVTACMLTTTPNDLVGAVHDRMPVILPRESYAEWLDPDTPESRLKGLLVPYPADLMTATAVGPAVNSPKNDGPECLDAARTGGGVARR